MTAPVQAGGPGAGGTLARLRERAKEIMAGFSSGQKTVVVLAVLAVVVGGYLFMSWAGQPSYVPLFSNLSSSDAAAITQKLAANKVPYQLAEGGEQVLVPQNDVYQQRLDMAAAGLPSSGTQGYSLLDQAGVTTSEFQQQVEYQQAVSDELEQTIESINGVNSAQVSVVIPQESLFSDNASSPSASVLVGLQPGTNLDAEQVQAIVHLVASSIEGLSPNDVTVADTNGDVLNAPGTDAGSAAAGSMDQQETYAYEQNLDSSLQTMLASIVGAGNAVVQTNAVLDFDQTQTNSNIYDPDKQGPIPVQQATSKETYSGQGATQAASGVLGSATTTTAATTTTTLATNNAAGANTTTSTAAGTGAATGTSTPSYVQQGASQQNVVSDVTKSVQSAPGALERLSVAVVINSSAVKNVNSAEISKLVSAAAGLQPARGDSIQVASMPFDQTQAQEAAAQLKAENKAKSQATLMGEARTVLVVIAVLVILVLALRKITKTTRVPLALPPGYQPLELEPGDAYADDEDVTLALAPAPHDARTESFVPVVPAPLEAEVSQIGQMIEREPERIAEMLRAWLEAPSDR